MVTIFAMVLCSVTASGHKDCDLFTRPNGSVFVYRTAEECRSDADHVNEQHRRGESNLTAFCASKPVDNWAPID